MSSNISGWATAIGVFVGASQLLLSRRSQVGAFESGFVERYREFARRVPLEAFLDGPNAYDSADETHRRAFYDYIELCEEELFYIATGRVSRRTAQEWSVGIQRNFERGSFKAARRDIFDHANGDFARLDRFFHDPKCVVGWRLDGMWLRRPLRKRTEAHRTAAPTS